MTTKKSPLGVLFLTLFLDLVGFSIIFPLFPEMLDYYFKVEAPGSLFDHLRTTLESLAGGDEALRAQYTAVLFGGVLGSLYSALQFLFAPVWGSLSDRFGRRPILLLSISGVAVSYILWTVSGSFELLILSRLLGGCMAGNISTASAAVADATTRANRAKGMGTIGAAFGLGFLFGPAIGGFSYALVGGADSTVDLLGRFPGLARFGVNPFSFPALLACLLSVLNLAWVGTRFQETSTPEQREAARRHPRPIHPLMLLRRIGIPGVSRANLAYFLFLLAFAGVEFTLTFFAYQAFGYRTRQITMIFIVAGLTIALVQGGIVRRVAPRFGERNVAVTGLALLVPAFFLISWSPPSQALLYTGIVMMAVGSALAIPCLTSLVSLLTPPERQGAVLGVFRSLGAASRAVGPLIFCSIYWQLGREWPYWIGGTLLLVPIAIAAALPQPSTAPQAESAAGEGPGEKPRSEELSPEESPHGAG